ncbi:MAG TPA: hypothetical protein VGR37_00475 [Longimicrobiaceae bacterium]|nr:hypothetical protein [Longimicrobiaceae bacterium]
MDNRDPHANEDTTDAREHVANAKENRDAQAAQAERVRATAPDSVDTPVGESQGSGAARDPENAAAMRRVAEDREALEEQNRRTAATAPDDVPMRGPDDRGDRP